MFHQIKTNKQTNWSRSFFSFWHCAGPYASRDGNLKIACHTAHIVTLGHDGGGKDRLTLNNSDTLHLHQPLCRVTKSISQFFFAFKKNIWSSGYPVSGKGGSTILPTLQRRWLRPPKVKWLTQDYRVTQGLVLCCSKYTGLPTAAISWACENHGFIGCCTKKREICFPLPLFWNALPFILSIS